jgi:hypothetical protein
MIMDEKPVSRFEKAAAEPADESLLGDLWDFLRHGKKWWLTPIVVILLLYGVLLLVYGTAAAPFLYTFF